MPNLMFFRCNVIFILNSAFKEEKTINVNHLRIYFASAQFKFAWYDFDISDIFWKCKMLHILEKHLTYHVFLSNIAIGIIILPNVANNFNCCNFRIRHNCIISLFIIFRDIQYMN